MDFLTWPARASTVAGRIDAVFNLLNAITVFFSLLIFACIIYLALKYRRGAKVDRSNPPHENLVVELGWTIIPAIICIIIFGAATWTYLGAARTPAGAMEIYVTGKQWMWKIQHPQGKWENNVLHVPTGRPVKLTMTSEDVIHSFYIPAFRVKQDVMPGRYTTLWFEATEPGEYHLFCAEYCGTKHSGMIGKVVVQKPADYELWLQQGTPSQSTAAQGEALFRQLGCGGCHGPGASVRAPLLNGIYNNPVAIEVPGGGTRVITADDRYIHDAILNPELEVAAGYKPIMPTFKGRVTEEQVLLLRDYIRSLRTSNGGSNGAAGQPEGATRSANSGAPLASPQTTNPGSPLSVPGTNRGVMNIPDQRFREAGAARGNGNGGSTRNIPDAGFRSSPAR